MQRSVRFPSIPELRRAHAVLLRRATFAASAAALLASLSHAQRFGFPEELVPPALANAAAPFATVDFDLDGDLDLMTSGAPGVLLNDGNGFFSPTLSPTMMAAFTLFPTAGAAPSVFPDFVVVDADLDGWPDLFGYDGTTTPLLGVNDTVGGFRAGTVPTVPVPPLPFGAGAVSAIAAGDFTGDGVVDLVLAVQPIAPLVFFRGLATGGWVDDSVVAFPTAPVIEANQLAAADFDLDGALDVLTAEPTAPASRRQLLRNTGAGVFAVPALVGTASLAPPAAETFVVANLDGNAFLDALYVPAAAATQTAPAEVVFDIAFLGGAPIGLGAPFPTAPLQVGSIATDAPGTPNTVPAAAFGSNALYLSHPAIGVQTFGVDVFAQLLPIGQNLLVFGNRGVVGDFDVDGDEDFASIRDVSAPPRVTRLIFTTPNGLVPIEATSNPSPTLNVAVPGVYRLGDGDGDFDLDLLTASGLIAANDGEGRFAWTASPGGVALTQTPLLAADLDGSGSVDTLTQPVGQPAQINFDPMVTPGVSAPLPGNLVGVNFAAASPIGPGFAVVQGAVVSYFLNFATLSIPVPVPPTLPIVSIRIADIDGDLDDDVLFSSLLPAGRVFLSLNTGTAAAPAFPTTAAITTSGALGFAVGDLNGDGLADLVGASDVYVQGPVGTFSFSMSLPGGPGWPFAPGLGDVDGDADLDVIGNVNVAGIVGGRVYLNNGLGGFGPSEALPAPCANPPALTDLDFDGDPDYVASNGMVVLNLLRQLALGLPARPGRPCTLQFFHELGGLSLFNVYAGTSVPYAAPAPFVGTVLVDVGTAGSPLPIAPNLSGAIAPLGTPLAINGDVHVQFLPAPAAGQPSLVGYTCYVQGAVTRPAFPSLYFLTGRRTLTIRDL